MCEYTVPHSNVVRSPFACSIFGKSLPACKRRDTESSAEVSVTNSAPGKWKTEKMKEWKECRQSKDINMRQGAGIKKAEDVGEWICMCEERKREWIEYRKECKKNEWKPLQEWCRAGEEQQIWGFKLRPKKFHLGSIRLENLMLLSWFWPPADASLCWVNVWLDYKMCMQIVLDWKVSLRSCRTMLYRVV